MRLARLLVVAAVGVACEGHAPAGAAGGSEVCLVSSDEQSACEAALTWLQQCNAVAGISLGVCTEALRALDAAAGLDGEIAAAAMAPGDAGFECPSSEAVACGAHLPPVEACASLVDHLTDPHDDWVSYVELWWVHSTPEPLEEHVAVWYRAFDPGRECGPLCDALVECLDAEPDWAAWSESCRMRFDPDGHC